MYEMKANRLQKILAMAVAGMLGGAVPAMAIEGTTVKDMEKVGDTLWLIMDKDAIAYNTVTGVYDTYHYYDYCTVHPDFANRYTNSVFNSVSAVNENEVWFGSTGNGIGLFDGSTMTWTTLDAYFCYIVKKDNNGFLWVGTGWNGLFRYDGEKWSKISTSAITAFPVHTDIEFDEFGLAWATMRSGGSAGFGYSNGNSWTSIAFKAPNWHDDFKTDSFSSLAIDDSDYKWLGLQHETKVCRFKKWNNYEIIELPSETSASQRTSDIQVGPDGRVWVASGKALYAIDNAKNIETIEIPLTAGDDYILCFRHDGDAIWIGTAKSGLHKWDGTTLTKVEGTAGIATVTADTDTDADTATYDLMGRKVERTIPGHLYIRSGRKFIAR